MIARIGIILIVILTVLSCESKTIPTTEAILMPNRSDLPFPVYNNFADITPLLEQHNDTTYVINFWATWCKPCIKEMPFFIKLAEDYQSKPLKIILVSLDYEKDLDSKLLDFTRDLPSSVSVVAMTEQPIKGWSKQLDKDWSGTIPVSIVYKNSLRFFVDDAFKTYNELKAQLTPLLK